MGTQFVEQVQLLMQRQQIKFFESPTNSNYWWLRNRKAILLWMTPKDEFLIRRAASKVDQEHLQVAIKRLLTWLDENPNAQSSEIPGICVNLLGKISTENLLNNVTLSRMTTFRNSLRRFSTISNKIAPAQDHLMPPVQNMAKRRSVTFNDVPTIYSIANRK